MTLERVYGPYYAIWVFKIIWYMAICYIWPRYHFEIIIGCGKWPQFHGSFGPEGFQMVLPRPKLTWLFL